MEKLDGVGKRSFSLIDEEENGEEQDLSRKKAKETSGEQSSEIIEVEVASPNWPQIIQ